MGLLAGLYFALRGRSRRVAEGALFAVLLAGFVLHFAKLFFEPYRSWMPYALRTVTPENLCAVSVLLFPWLFLSRGKLARDYLFYMGVVSGLGATLIPVDVIGRPAFEFETLRFYFSHVTLWVVPLLMVMLKVHALDYRRIPRVPLLVYAVMGVIVVNEVILIGAGFVHAGHLFSSEVRNSALIFGPLSDVEFLGRLFLPLTPPVFTRVPVGPNAGAVFYWPIVWLVVPSFVYFSAVSFLLALPFQYGKVLGDLSALRLRLRRLILRRKG